MLLDVAKQLHDDKLSIKEHLVVNHRYFYDGSFHYGTLDRLGGVLSHLNKVFKDELKEALGREHENLPEAQESTNFLRDIYSTMFLVSNNTGTFSLVRNVGNEHHHELPISLGNSDNHKSVCEIIDCCIMFYHSVAYKYVVMIADLRDNITHLSNILIETKHCREEVLKNLDDFKNSMEGVSSAQDEVLKELSERFLERKNIFAVRNSFRFVYFHLSFLIF